MSSPRAVVRRPHDLGRRDGAALLLRQPADDGRRHRGDPRLPDGRARGRHLRHRFRADRRSAPWLTIHCKTLAGGPGHRRAVRGDHVRRTERRARRDRRRLGGDHRGSHQRRRRRSAALRTRAARRHRLPRHAGAHQRPPPPVPEPDPGLSADDRQAAVRMAAVAVSAVAGARHRVGLRVGLGRPGRAGLVGLHHVDRSPLPAPRGAGDLLTAEIEAARDLGVRFHPTRGSMSLSEKDGGLPPDDVVADDDEILAACEEAVARHHDRSFGAMTRIALAPCSPFSRDRGTDGPIGRARRAARRAAAHPLRRERRGRRVQPGDVRLPADGVPRTHRVVHRPDVGGALRDARRRRDRGGSARPASAPPTAPRAT